MSSSGVGRDVHSDVVYPACPLPTTMLPTLQGALKDGFGEAVTVCDLPEACKFPSLPELPEEVPVDLHGSRSCSVASRWSYAPSRRCGEVSSGTCFRKPGSFFPESVSRVHVTQP